MTQRCPGWEKPIHHALTRFPSGTLVYLDDTHTIQAALVIRPEEDRPGSAWFEFIAVTPGAPGGVGRQLMEFAERWLAAQKFHSARLSMTNKSEKLADFYIKAGYLPTEGLIFEKKFSAPPLEGLIKKPLRMLRPIETLVYRISLIF